MVRFWPIPAGRASIAGCQVERLAAGATGRKRPITALVGLAPREIIIAAAIPQVLGDRCDPGC